MAIYNPPFMVKVEHDEKDTDEYRRLALKARLEYRKELMFTYYAYAFVVILAGVGILWSTYF